MKKQVIIVIFLLGTISPVFNASDGPVAVEDPCRKEKFATAEPGTCLDPKAYRLLEAINTVQNNPYNNEFAKRVIDVFEPRVHTQADTIVASEQYDIPVRIYYPTNGSTVKPTQLALFIHGGGFMFGSIETYDMAVKKLARVTGYIIVSVDYRLAPEHPYPAALDDLTTVLNWMVENRSTIGGNNQKIIVIGDSAGANLATVLALKQRDQQRDNILCQVLYYPPTTFEEIEFPSRIYFLRDERRTYLLSEEFVRESKDSYLAGNVSATNPYVSPLRADLSGHLPPVLILNAEVDPLRDEGRLYAEKLREAGQSVTYMEFEGMIHGFFNFYMIFREGKESMKLIKAYVDGLQGQISAP